MFPLNSLLLTFIVSSARNEALPSFLSVKKAIHFFATSLSSTMISCKLPDTAASIALANLSSNLISEINTPSIPLIPLFRTSLTDLKNPSLLSSILISASNLPDEVFS